MVFVALTANEKIQLAIAAVTGLATLIALANVAVAVVNERRRSQPIVIAHEAGERRFAPSASTAAWVVDSFITSDGGGPAFNIRFGVEFNGVRYPYRLNTDDPDSGNLQRVLRPDGQLPPSGSWPILIDTLSLLGRAAENKQRGDLDARRVYWARYENARGQTWETRNPGDRSTKLDIRRIRWPWWYERREQRRRAKAGQHDAAWERQMLESLRVEAAQARARAESDE